MLVVAAEDYTGASPVQIRRARTTSTRTPTPWPPTASRPTSTTSTRPAGRPDALGVLSHYDAVVWETGNDLVTRTAGRGGGNADRLALDELLEFRSYMNEGGKVLLAGDSAGQQYTMAQLYDPKGEIACNPRLRAPTRGAACPCSARSSVATPPTTCCSTGWVATLPWPTTVMSRRRVRLDGRRRPVHGPRVGPRRSRLRRQHAPRSSFLATSGILPVDQFKQFDSWPARGVRQAGPFDPHTGTVRLLADRRRLLQEAHPRDRRPGSGGSMTFWTSYDTERGTTCSWRPVLRR